MARAGNIGEGLYHASPRGASPLAMPAGIVPADSGSAIGISAPPSATSPAKRAIFGISALSRAGFAAPAYRLPHRRKRKARPAVRPAQGPVSPRSFP
ncbi:hypothetical protein Pden_5042 (plasmid) [Paracoccus denitrificans PD1222]|uniref:Uncharacterized protein n=1 Tax=Paracoccus denitrificans (strain Pd 1222) TaxID=318586 RepID=A1BC58_PARDP|nr:hypothetical protein Pden_5042 [Paracoccus denitrificans PD1222]